MAVLALTAVWPAATKRDTGRWCDIPRTVGASPPWLSQCRPADALATSRLEPVAKVICFIARFLQGKVYGTLLPCGGRTVKN